MLMVFTRARRKPGERSWLGRLLRRGKGEISTSGTDEEPAAEPDVAYPKAAE
jgi:multidrug efflux pump